MDLSTPIQYVKGVGPRRAEQFAQLGVATAGDLLLHFPRDYIDRSRFVAIGSARAGDTITLIGRVRSVQTIRTRRGQRNVVACIADASGEIGCVWFNQPFREKQLPVGAVMMFSGTVGVFRGMQMTNPEFEPLEDDEQERLHTGRIVPVYPLTDGLTQRIVRAGVREVLDGVRAHVLDPLPEEVRVRRALVPRVEALESIHFPASWTERDRARERLAFDELLALQLVLTRRRRAQAGDRGIAFETDGPLLARFRTQLPFALTSAQERSLGEILADMRAPRVMHRLLHGDVGSGKTVVSVGACVAACDSGYQAALMAPTEILAEQHHATVTRLLSDLPIRVALLTGRVKAAARREILYGVASGAVGIVCGTHALIQEDVRFARLGLSIIDEQQRFGVRHRLALREKAGDLTPDVLVTTATPIPRTLAMTFYGDLDVSTLDQLPPGRGEISTHLTGPEKRERAFEFVARTAREGQQTYVVYPAIDESDTLAVRAATKMAETLRADARFAGLTVGLVHGKQKAHERDGVMEDFRRGAVHVLVATTVIEVGVDVPNATIMVVEHPERYGLSQLHQLRGRVGRGAGRSYFVLLADDALSPEARERLQVLVDTRDGFRVAEEDLRRRGPGELLGTRQHGVPQLRAANLFTDTHLLTAARDDADALLRDDPDLAAHPTLRAALDAWFGDAEKLLASG